jgi:predicted transcriptional regulator
MSREPYDPGTAIVDVLYKIEHRLGQIVRALRRLSRTERKAMSIGQDILDAVTAETTEVDSYLTLTTGLINNGTISAPQGAAILAAIKAEKEKVQAAIIANTVPATPTPAVTPAPVPAGDPANPNPTG